MVSVYWDDSNSNEFQNLCLFCISFVSNQKELCGIRFLCAFVLFYFVYNCLFGWYMARKKDLMVTET